MAGAKKIKSIPTEITIGTGKNKETLIHYISLKTKGDSDRFKKQHSSQFSKIEVEPQILGGKTIYSIYVLRIDEVKAREEKDKMKKEEEARVKEESEKRKKKQTKNK